MTGTLVFMHGRGQEFKNPAALVRNWRAGLAGGLIKANMPPLPDVPVVLPFYGNLLYQITAQVAQDPIQLEALPANPDEAGPLHPGLPEDIGEPGTEPAGGHGQRDRAPRWPRTRPSAWTRCCPGAAPVTP